MKLELKQNIKLLQNRIRLWKEKGEIALLFNKENFLCCQEQWKKARIHLKIVKKLRKTLYQLWLKDKIDIGLVPSAQWRSYEAMNFTKRRDNWTCQKCGDRNGKVEAHHINPPSNKSKDLITLCINHHPYYPFELPKGKDFWKWLKNEEEKE